LQCVVAYDSSSDDGLQQVLPSAATINAARLHADPAYFQNGLVRANVSWQTDDNDDDDDDKGS